MKRFVLYQPDDVLRERVPSVKLLAAYVTEVQAVCSTYFADASTPEALDIVVAIKPGGRSNVWFVSPSRLDDDASFGRLRQQIELVKPPEVRAGPVAVAIMGALAGAERESPSPGTFSPPMPKAWRDAASKASQKLEIPDDVLRQVWPDP